MLYATISRYLTGSITKDQRLAIGEALLLSVFKGGLTFAQMRASISKQQLPFDVVSFKRTRSKKGSGDLLLNIKTYTYSLAFDKPYSARDCDITIKEAAFLRAVYAKSKKLRALFNRYKKAGFDCLPPSKITALGHKVLNSPDFRAFLGKFINKKMLFLIHSYGIPFSDIENDLIEFSWYAILRAYPCFNDEEHPRTIAHSAAPKRGINLIKFHTAQCRARLTKEADGSYSSAHIPLSGLIDESGFNFSDDQTFSDEWSTNILGQFGNTDTDFENRIALHQLMDSPDLGKNARYFLRLLSGVHDPKFSKFLGGPNDEFIERNDYQVYLEKAREFVGVTEHQTQRFFERLRKHF